MKEHSMKEQVFREVAIRYSGPHRKAETIRSPADAARYFRAFLTDDATENFMAIYLDGAHQPIAIRLVSRGTANEALVHPREVFQIAVLLGACAVLVAHNHPSGSIVPSPQDKTMTDRLRAAGDLLGIPLLDSLVLGEGVYSDREGRPW